MKSVIQKYKSLIKKLREKEMESMFLDVDLELEISSRKNLARNYSIICNQIHSGGSNDSICEIKIMLDNKKANISQFLQKKIENKRQIKEIRNKLSNLVK